MNYGSGLCGICRTGAKGYWDGVRGADLQGSWSREIVHCDTSGGREIESLASLNVANGMCEKYLYKLYILRRPVKLIWEHVLGITIG